MLGYKLLRYLVLVCVSESLRVCVRAWSRIVAVSDRLLALSQRGGREREWRRRIPRSAPADWGGAAFRR